MVDVSAILSNPAIQQGISNNYLYNFAHTPSPTSKYPFVGPHWKGEQPGYVYDPYSDQYKPDPNTQRALSQSEGLTPTLAQQLIPGFLAMGGSALAQTGGKLLAQKLFGAADRTKPANSALSQMLGGGAATGSGGAVNDYINSLPQDGAGQDMGGTSFLGDGVSAADTNSMGLDNVMGSNVGASFGDSGGGGAGSGLLSLLGLGGGGAAADMNPAYETAGAGFPSGGLESLMAQNTISGLGNIAAGNELTMPQGLSLALATGGTSLIPGFSGFIHGAGTTIGDAGSSVVNTIGDAASGVGDFFGSLF